MGRGVHVVQGTVQQLHRRRGLPRRGRSVPLGHALEPVHDPLRAQALEQQFVQRRHRQLPMGLLVVDVPHLVQQRRDARAVPGGGVVHVERRVQHVRPQVLRQQDERRLQRQHHVPLVDAVRRVHRQVLPALRVQHEGLPAGQRVHVPARHGPMLRLVRDVRQPAGVRHDVAVQVERRPLHETMPAQVHHAEHVLRRRYVLVGRYAPQVLHAVRAGGQPRRVHRQPHVPDQQRHVRDAVPVPARCQLRRQQRAPGVQDVRHVVHACVRPSGQQRHVRQDLRVQRDVVEQVRLWMQRAVRHTLRLRPIVRLHVGRQPRHVQALVLVVGQCIVLWPGARPVRRLHDVSDELVDVQCQVRRTPRRRGVVQDGQRYVSVGTCSWRVRRGVRVPHGAALVHRQPPSVRVDRQRQVVPPQVQRDRR
eukprot:PhM_4_TR14672/c6_g1_i1/m.87658